MSARTSSPEPVDQKQVLLDKVNFIVLGKSRFDSIMVANFFICNPTKIAFKDFTVTCKHRGSSGTEIDSNTRTIYELVEAYSAKEVRNFNMGFVDSQAKSSSCRITDLVPLG